jgi:hypothetical protein
MGLNEVFKKVADIERNATELASHKVELATPDDLEKKKIQGAKELETANALAKTVAASIDKVITAYRQNLISCFEGLKIADDVNAQFKQLNFPPPAYIAAWSKELTANQKQSNAKMKALEAAKKSIS